MKSKYVGCHSHLTEIIKYGSRLLCNTSNLMCSYIFSHMGAEKIHNVMTITVTYDPFT